MGKNTKGERKTEENYIKNGEKGYKLSYKFTNAQYISLFMPED